MGLIVNVSQWENVCCTVVSEGKTGKMVVYGGSSGNKEEGIGTE